MAYLLLRGGVTSERVDWETDGAGGVLCEGGAECGEVQGDASTFGEIVRRSSNHLWP